MDFGLARLGGLGDDARGDGDGHAALHVAGAGAGRARRRAVRRLRAWAACSTSCSPTGKPFDADSMHSVLFKVMQEEPPPVHEVTPGIPTVLTQVVERAMAKDTTQRFQNAGRVPHRAPSRHAGRRQRRGRQGPARPGQAPWSRTDARGGGVGDGLGLAVRRRLSPPAPEVRHALRPRAPGRPRVRPRPPPRPPLRRRR